jgi:hypothetical protein
MPLVAKHLAGVDTALQLLATDQSTDMGFMSRKIAFFGLGLVLGRATLIGTLMLAAGAKASARTIASWQFIAVETHVGTNSLNLSSTTATIDLDSHLTRSAFSQMTFLHTPVATLQVLLAKATTDRNGIRARRPRLALE